MRNHLTGLGTQDRPTRRKGTTVDHEQSNKRETDIPEPSTAQGADADKRREMSVLGGLLPQGSETR